MAEADPINPSYYQGFSNGAQVIDITEHLTSNGGQAVQYVARSTRLDGNNKGDIVENLKKAVWFIEREVELLEKTTISGDFDSYTTEELDATEESVAPKNGGVADCPLTSFRDT